MGIFSFLKSKGKPFLSASDHKINLARQVEMTTKVIEQLRHIDVTDKHHLCIEYFFYANNPDNAKQLSGQLSSLGYSIYDGPSVSDKNLFIITGWTQKMKMEDAVIAKWVNDMCDLGYKFDCEFDGWGTTPDQDENP